MNYEKYLPVGTVVLLKNGKKRVMITGFCCVSKETDNKVWDYTGCLYPEGYVKTNTALLFDHNQIEKIYYLGLIDEEEKKFKNELKQIMQQNNATNNSQVNPGMNQN